MAPRAEWLPFRDRREAGQLLADELLRYRNCRQGIVLGLPRGGVPVAAAVAAALCLPLDVVISRKLRAPRNAELAIGAVAEGGTPEVDDEAVTLTGASAEYVAGEIARQESEIASRQHRFRAGRRLILPRKAMAILVDDGIATGSTLTAAIAAVRAQRPGRLVVAAPVAPPDTAERLRPLVDDLVLLATPQPFYAVGVYYEDFAPVTDDEVVTMLDAFHAARAEAARARRSA